MAFTSASWRCVFAASGVAALTSTAVARADESGSRELPVTDSPTPHAIDRSWLYLDDAKLAAPGAVIGMTSASFTNAGTNPDPSSAPYRAFAANTAQRGVVAALGAEAGVLPRVSLEAVGQAQFGGEGSGVNPGAIAGARFQLSPPSWSNVHMTASAGYLRETSSTPGPDSEATATGGANGAWASFAVAFDVQRLRLGVTTLGEHVFATGRDSVDVMVQAGASYRVMSWLRAGVEWVGQDLEETFADQAEGGPRHFVGPTAAVQLLQDRLTIVGGPSVGLSNGSPNVLGRLALAYGF